MSVTWNILWILPCSVSLMFATLVEYIFLALLSCWHLYASLWFSKDILLLTKSFPENFKFENFWDLAPRLLCLYVTVCFYSHHLNFTITLSDLFILWQTCRSSGAMLTSVKDNALQTLASKTSWISARTWFTLIISLLLYWEFVTALRSSWIILLRRWELKLLHCCISE